MSKKKCRIISLVLCIMVMTGCAENPKQEVVVSKNDGSFDVNVIQSATEPEPTAEATEETNLSIPEEPTEAPKFHYESDFSSTDGTVNFHFDFELEENYGAMPVVEVAPHYLTEADVKHIANVFFGDVDVYEAQPLNEEVYSVAEIQEKITRLLNYEGNIGHDSGLFYTARNMFIEEYTVKMETAPAESQQQLTQWEWRKSSYYYWSPEELAQMDLSQDNDEMQLRVKVNGIPYLMTVSTRNRNDFKLNNINIMIDDGPSPLSADYYIFQNQLCSTEEPTDEDLEFVSKKAEQLLQDMQLGEWQIDECYVEVETNNEKPEYIVVVKAVPSFEDAPTLRRNQLTNLKSKASFASNYYMTDAEFKFSIRGDLLYFMMYSPIDTRAVITTDVQTLSYDELIQKAENHLALSDYHQYDTLGFLLDNTEELVCNIGVNDVKYGLTRVKVPDTDESYYYVPAIMFSGTTQFEGKESGAIYDTNSEYAERYPFLILNAIDGSVINATNE